MAPYSASNVLGVIDHKGDLNFDFSFTTFEIWISLIEFIFKETLWNLKAIKLRCFLRKYKHFFAVSDCIPLPSVK